VKLHERAKTDYALAARLLLAARGVDPSARAIAGALLEVEYREQVRGFLVGMGGQ
jgi:hypothetical protein